MFENIEKKYEEKKEQFYTKYIKPLIKPLLTIFIYILYQNNFLISLASSFGIYITKLPMSIRIPVLFTNDLIYIATFLLLYKEDIKNGIKDLKKNTQEKISLALGCWSTGCIIMATSSIIIGLILGKSVSGNEEAVRESIKVAPLYMLFACSIVAPLFEEMVFRKAFYHLIKPKWLFILLSGLTFGAIHVLGSYTTPLDFLYTIPYGAMGCCFAYLLTKTKNITLPILVHFVHNTILVLMQIIRG